MTSEHRRAKIMATLGPASRDEAVLGDLLEAGLDIVRLNLSHGSHDSHRELIRRVRRLAAEHNRPVPIVLDLMGPRYRVGDLDQPLELAEGSAVRLSREGHESDSDDLSLPVEDSVLEYLREDERVLIDDGLVELRVRERRGDEAVAEVVFGGRVSSRKGINLPDTELPFEVSDKDERDIRFAVEEGLDYIAASYVGAPEDVQAIRDRIRDAGGDLPVIAKLERSRAVECLEEMVEAADALMVARGDLGVEVPLPRVPVLQKLIVTAGRQAGKPVIVATQMLESMTEQPRPTRAEATDVANAVFDGADALMLSGETAAGKYPVESVATMDRVIREAETHQRGIPSSKSLLFPLENARVGELRQEGHRSQPQKLHPDRPAEREVFGLADVVCSAAVWATGRAAFRWIVSFSQGGFTARVVARYRPAAPILVLTPRVEIARRVQLLWGVRPLVVDVDVTHHDEVVQVVERELRVRDLAADGDAVLLLMGDPIPERPLTNLLRVHRLGGPARGASDD